MTQPRLVGGRYELGELLGYGGMAEVHRGRDSRLNREVAIKLLRADLARDPSFLNRFRREAHSAAGLNHPSIVAVYDTGEDAGPDGTPQPFIVMEYVHGRTLRDIVKSEGRPSARNPEIPRAIDSIVMKALAKNPLNRYQSAGDMRQDLVRALADQPVNAEMVMTDAERTQFIARTPAPPIALRRDEYVDEDNS